MADAIGAAPILFIRPTKGFLRLNLREIWDYRELLYFLVWRDVKVRYKQTVLGAAWAVLHNQIRSLDSSPGVGVQSSRFTWIRLGVASPQVRTATAGDV